MSNVGRVITLVVRVEDDAPASQLWVSHAENSPIAGCRILAISEGNAVRSSFLQEAYLEYLAEKGVFDTGRGIVEFEAWRDGQ